MDCVSKKIGKSTQLDIIIKCFLMSEFINSALLEKLMCFTQFLLSINNSI